MNPGSRRWTGIVAGLVGGSAVTLAIGIVHLVDREVPFPPLAIAQTLVRSVPGGVATKFIELLGHWALRLAVIGTVVAFLLAGGVAGLVLTWLERPYPKHPVAGSIPPFLALWLASVALYPSSPDGISRGPFALVSLPAFLLGGAVAGRVHARLGAGTTSAPRTSALRTSAAGASPAPDVPDLSRRYLLRALAFGGLGILAGSTSLARLFRTGPDPGDTPLRLANEKPTSAPSAAPGDAAFSSIPGLASEVTPNDLFYVVDEEIVNPLVNPASWRLTVGGLVRRPISLSYDQLTAMPTIERYQTLECISNDVGGGLISNAKWAGIPLPEVLDLAGIRPGAVEVVFRAIGGYSDSLSVETALDERTLIAIGMNDRFLPRDHGFPARILSVGTYGMKNPKWLTSIEVVDKPYQGFWEERGWTKAATVKTWSRIDTPQDGTGVGPGVIIAGVAFAGDRGISRVEVSTDGGRTWHAAELKTPLSDLTWRLWRYRWVEGPRGDGQILVRAYDGRGNLQAAKPTAPHPSGATGYNSIEVGPAS